MKKHLVIGGPKHGELVNWPMKHKLDHWAVPNHTFNPLSEGPQVTYYIAMPVELFGRECAIWLHERYSPIDPEKWADKFAAEILSYKGGVVWDVT